MALYLDPIRLSDTDKKRTASILDGWIDRAEDDRKEQVEEWKMYLRSWEGKAPTDAKTFPWPDCSNIDTQIGSIMASAILSRLHQAIYSQDKTYKIGCQDSRPEVLELSGELDDALNFEARERIRMSRKTRMWESDAVYLGTGFLKGSWEDLRRIQYLPDRNGEIQAREVFDAYGPTIDHCPIEDILLPSDAAALNGPRRCQFIDHVIPLRWDQLVARQAYGYEDVDDVKGKTYSAWELEIKEERDRVLGIQRIRREILDIHEIWCNFPVYELDAFPNRKVKIAGGKTQEREFVELCITYHAKTRTLLRVVENWYEDGKRPFWALSYIPRSTSVYGIGVARLVHLYQEGINTILNQRVDNGTVANTRFWKAKKLSVPRGMTISPSKVVFMDDPNDLVGEQLGDLYPTAFSNEASLVNYAERRTGVSDYQLGRESSGNYQATATSTLKLIDEGNVQWDYTLDEWRDSFAQLGMWLLSCFRQFGYAYDGILEQQFGPEKAEKIRRALEIVQSTPTYALFSMDLMVAKASTSAASDLQKTQVLMDMTERWYATLFDLIGRITRGVDENGVPFTDAQKAVAYEAIEAGMALYKRILHSMNVPDKESYLPNRQSLEEAAQGDLARMEQMRAQMMQMQAMGMGMGMGPGGMNGGGNAGPGSVAAGPAQNPGGSGRRGRPPVPGSSNSAAQRGM